MITRAFEPKPGCEVPSISAITSGDYAFPSCDLPALSAMIRQLQPYRQSPIFDNPIPPPPKVKDVADNKEFWAAIGGYEDGAGLAITDGALSSQNWFKYGFVEVYKSAPGKGRDKWEVMLGGRSGDAALNTIECINSKQGLQGNGTTMYMPIPMMHEDLNEPHQVKVGEFFYWQILPCPKDVVVKMTEEHIDSLPDGVSVSGGSGDVEYLFSYENQSDICIKWLDPTTVFGSGDPPIQTAQHDIEDLKQQVADLQGLVDNLLANP